MRKITPIGIALVLLGIIFIGALYKENKKWELSENQKGVFSQTVNNYPDATTPQVITLKNGDTYDLTASFVKKVIGKAEVKMLAYNGSVPGPMVKVKKGSSVTVRFANKTDVDTTIHSHGVRLSNQYDGVPDITQKAVKPGESFTYVLTFPDVGVYWYHPHVREDYAQELGLYGNFIVEPDTVDYWAEVDHEEALFFDDILVQNGQIAAFNETTVDHTLMGRFGNTMLVNGSDRYTLAVKQGERVRFYLTNAAGSRVFNVSIPNARMKLVGSDNGKYEREEWIDSVMIGPSERAVVEIWFDTDGEYQIIHKTPQKSYTMGIIDVQQGPVTWSYFLIPRVNQDMIDALAPLRPYFEKAVDKTLKLTLDMMPAKGSGSGMQHMMGNGQMMGNSEMSMGKVEKIEWEDDMGMMNSQSTTNTLKWKLIDQETNKENMDIDWQFKKGDIVKVEVFNDDKSMHPMQHPIHVHGQRFLVSSTNGVTNTNLVWKDTTLIQAGDRVELLVQMDNPGNWVIHCHIPEHMEAGMMTKYSVL